MRDFLRRLRWLRKEMIGCHRGGQSHPDKDQNWRSQEMDMKVKQRETFALLLLIGLFLLTVKPATAQTTEITYVGKLTEAGVPASGTFDLQFKIFNTKLPFAGVPVGPTIVKVSVDVPVSAIRSLAMLAPVTRPAVATQCSAQMWVCTARLPVSTPSLGAPPACTT